MLRSLSAFTAGCVLAASSFALDVQDAVDAAVRPLIARYAVSGLVVAVTVDGRHAFHRYGPVTENTLFEIGSLSKTFTATLGAYAAETGALAFDAPAGKYLPALAGSPAGAVPVLEFGTYTAGGLPLQFPQGVEGDGAVDWLRQWRPATEPGAFRQYSNPGIGLFGELAARSLGGSFAELMERKLFPALGLHDTFIRVPAARMVDYAWGTAKDGRPVRVNPGPFDAQAYGVKTTAADMLRFLDLQVGAATAADGAWQRAITATHTGYYRVGPMTQGLGWEMYPWPVPLATVLAGNANAMALQPNRAVRITPPQPPRADLLLNKTGSTNGFGAYAAFVPAKRIGVVLLANRNYPNEERVRAGHAILRALESQR